MAIKWSIDTKDLVTAIRNDETGATGKALEVEALRAQAQKLDIVEGLLSCLIESALKSINDEIDAEIEKALDDEVVKLEHDDRVRTQNVADSMRRALAMKHGGVEP